MTNLVTVMGALFSLIGASLAIVAGRQFEQRMAFLRTSAVAPGVVVALRPERDGLETHSFRYPRIRFQTPSGRAIMFESGVALSGQAWRIGDAVSVRYRRDHPETAEVDGFVTLWGATVLFAVLAAVFLVVGTALLFRLIAL